MRYRHPVTNEILPMTLSVAAAAALLGESRQSVWRKCVAGDIACAKRRTDRSPWQIITARLMEDYGHRAEEGAA